MDSRGARSALQSWPGLSTLWAELAASQSTGLGVLQRGPRRHRVRALMKEHLLPEWCEAKEGPGAPAAWASGPPVPALLWLTRFPLVMGTGHRSCSPLSHGFPFPASSWNYSNKSITASPGTRGPLMLLILWSLCPPAPDGSLCVWARPWRPRWRVLSTLGGCECMWLINTLDYPLSRVGCHDTQPCP